MNYAEAVKGLRMKQIIAIILIAALGRGFAQAEPIVLGEWEIEPKLEATVAVSPGRDDAGESEVEFFTGELYGELRAERVLDNGLKIGTWIGARAQRDHPARPGFSGRIGDGLNGMTEPVLRGAFTGLTLGGAEDDRGVRIQLETAFVFIDGGYGELLAGRDLGIARRFHEGSPSVFHRHTISNARLDTSGISTLLTRNDLTGPAAKVSYASPRILGLRLGASYTPRANVSGLDRDPDRLVAGNGEPRLEDGVEVAFNFNHRFREAGVRVQAYGAYGRARVETVIDNTAGRLNAGTVEVWSTGGVLEWDRFEFGADWLTTDNAGGRYKAWSIGAKTRVFGFDGSLTYGQSDDELTQIEGEAWSIGVSKQYFERLTLNFGVQSQSLEGDFMSSARSTGPVIEMTLEL